MEEKKEKKRPVKIKAAERRRRSENMRQMNIERAKLRKEEQERENALLKKDMPVNDRKFADLYVWGDKSQQGDMKQCYADAFGITLSDVGQKARKLLARPHIAEYIDKQMVDYEMLLRGEKLKNLQTLTKIRDEMSEAEYVNRWGEINGVAACRTVAIKATETINNMLGFDKPKEVNVNHGAGGGGITFNLVVPEPDCDTIDIDCDEVD